MKLRLLTLACLAFAGTASAQEPRPEGEIYAAHGTEPFWGLTFEDGKMVYRFEEERIEVVRPRPTTSRSGAHVYRTPRLTVEISHEGRCDDGMSEYEYPDTVRIRFGRSRSGRALEGCGGGILPPVTLMDTGWQIVDIDGTQVGGAAYELQFDADGIHARAGCNRLSGSYTQVGRTLTFGAIRSTRMACGDEPGTHERKVLQLLGGPVEISYRGGMIMVLQANRDGTNVYLTLRRL
jgi:heat shock protein HslJ/uncharacterized membrane protein